MCIEHRLLKRLIQSPARNDQPASMRNPYIKRIGPNLRAWRTQSSPFAAFDDVSSRPNSRSDARHRRTRIRECRAPRFMAAQRGDISAASNNVAPTPRPLDIIVDARTPRVRYSAHDVEKELADDLCLRHLLPAPIHVQRSLLQP